MGLWPDRTDEPVAFAPAHEPLGEGSRLYCEPCFRKRFGKGSSLVFWRDQVNRVARKHGELLRTCGDCSRDFLS